MRRAKIAFWNEVRQREIVLAGALARPLSIGLFARAIWQVVGLAILAFISIVPCAFSQEPSFFGAPPGALARAKATVTEGRGSTSIAVSTTNAAFNKILEDARKALKQKPLSVMDKPKVPEGMDKHDYFSTAPYFWPDPNKTNGLPYIRKDGYRNPDSHNENSDSSRLGRICGTAETLALAYYFTRDEAYAAHAAELLSAWFLNPATRMNPNFDHAQAVPGVNTGRGTGMIESRSLIGACDAAALLHDAKAWPRTYDEAFKSWMRSFLEWSQTSRNGRAEAAAKNNHGSFYDLQIAHFALFLGETNLARQIVERAKTKRIDPQIEPDGRQPLELSREDGWGYSRFNLQALFELAALGEHVGVDLWHYESPKGGSIRKALDFLVDYVEHPAQPWPYEKSKKAARNLGALPRRAFLAYHDSRYRKLIDDDATSRDCLFYPLPSE